MSVAPLIAGPAILAAFAALTIPTTQRSTASEVAALSASLGELSSLPVQRAGETSSHRTALEVYIAGRFGPMIADEQVWHSPL